jgi:hypothetical protein
MYYEVPPCVTSHMRSSLYSHYIHNHIYSVHKVLSSQSVVNLIRTLNCITYRRHNFLTAYVV